MKTVELKKIPFELQGQQDVFDYRDMLKVLIENPADEKAMGIPEMRKSLRVLDVLESLGESAETVDFEDSDFEYIQERVRKMRFVAAHRVFADFADYFENLG